MKKNSKKVELVLLAKSQITKYWVEDEGIKFMLLINKVLKRTEWELSLIHI